jgi:hypothetical protein
MDAMLVVRPAAPKESDPAMTLTPDTADLLARARTWLAEDPDPDTRVELAELLASAEGPAEEQQCAAWSELAERFAGTLQFGTAGLRGEMGAGPMRMNRAVVIRAAAGLAAYVGKRSPGGLVVIGYDGTSRPTSPATPPPWSSRPVCAPCCCRARCPPRCSPSLYGTWTRPPESW